MQAVIYTGKNYKTMYSGKVLYNGTQKITIVTIQKDGSTKIRSFDKEKNIVKIVEDENDNKISKRLL